MTIDWREPVIGNPEQLRPLIPENTSRLFEAFDVYGSGLMFFSKHIGHRTGPASGFAVMDSTSKYGLAIGVMDAKEARRLADHIYAALGSPVPDRRL